VRHDNPVPYTYPMFVLDRTLNLSFFCWGGMEGIACVLHVFYFANMPKLK
jgi:hypothetical protein